MTIERQKLVDRAIALGIFCEPEALTDQQLRDGIAAEEACGDWLAEWERRGCPQWAADRLAKDFGL